MSSGRLIGRTTLISGGAGGVGRAAALKFAGEGAAIAIVDRNKEAGSSLAEDIRSTSGVARFYEADVSRLSSIEAVASAALQDFGRIDVLFNHAGSIVVAPFLETTEEEWDWLMAVNVKSMFFMTKAILPSMLATGQGVIINTSSISADCATPMESLYCMTKAAVSQFTRAIAIEYRDKNIRCNAICPGFIRTAHGITELERLSALGLDVSDSAIEAMQGRICEPMEVANAAFLLALDEASFVNGAMLHVDNGLTASA